METPATPHPGPQKLPPTIHWSGGLMGALELLDQTLLPHQISTRRCETAEQVWQAIRELCVRGAPAIGVAAAYGMVLGLRKHVEAPLSEFQRRVAEVADYLNSSRPTAVNLSWATRRIAGVAARQAGPAAAVLERILAAAHAMHREDAEVCRAIGVAGAELIHAGAGVLTHCNAGGLATVAYGTATAPMYVAHQAGRPFRVYADETRPLLQGARLTALELSRAGIDVTVLCDGAAASLMQAGKVDLVIVGADRIAANGDTANKIGTLGVAIAAAHHGIPFYVAAPSSTFDLAIADGRQIPIEHRPEQEVRGGFGQEMVAPGVPCHNPAFDVTPAALIRGIITERGIITPVNAERISAKVGAPRERAG